jgi:hypothetical protein
MVGAPGFQQRTYHELREPDRNQSANGGGNRTPRGTPSRGVAGPDKTMPLILHAE